jgi:hypothetical protein
VHAGAADILKPPVCATFAPEVKVKRAVMVQGDVVSPPPGVDPPKAPPTAANAQSHTGVCKLFAKGECKYGDKCKFQHVAAEKCRLFAEGKCNRGDKCRFKH